MAHAPHETEDLNPRERWFVHALTLLAGACVVLSLIYWLYRFTTFLTLTIIVVVGIVGWACRPTRQRPASRKPLEPRDIALHAAFFAIEAMLIAVFWIARTDQAIVSPWDVLPSFVFILFGLASFFLILTLRVTPERLAPYLVSLHALTAWGVALAVYALGFGYDPFVHQATESHILNNGFILPKQPFYVGQYAMVTALWTVTGLSVHVLDAFLVPVLAVLTAPVALMIGSRHGWGAERNKGRVGLIALFLLPMAVFTFTIPFNLATLFLFLIVCLLPLARDRRTNIALWALALAALVTHPLLGLPALVLVATALAGRSWFTFAPVLAIPATLVGAMAIYVAMNGAPLLAPSLGDIGDSLRAIFSIPYDLANAPWTLVALYTLEHWWPLVVVVLGIWSLLTTRPAHGRILISTAIGLLLSAVGLAAFVRLPDIIANEQFEFPLRLIATIPLLFIPAIAALLDKLLMRRAYALPALLAAVMTGAWFFSYPQQNAVANTTSQGLGHDDVEAVRVIEDLARRRPYVVLSHQMMGAAALTQLGFSTTVMADAGARPAYAIPTGSELYGFYFRMWTDDPSVVLNEIRDFANVTTVFVAVPNSWDPDAGVRTRLSHVASTVRQVGGIALFEFE